MSPNDNLTDQNLDPKDWETMRALGHQMVDDLIDYWKGIREEKIWRPIPEEVKAFLDQPIPENGQTPEEVYQEFKPVSYTHLTLPTILRV